MKKIAIILVCVLVCFSLFTGCTDQKAGGGALISAAACRHNSFPRNTLFHNHAGPSDLTLAALHFPMIERGESVDQFGIFHAVWSVWSSSSAFSLRGRPKNSAYSVCTSGFSWEKRMGLA